MNLVVEMFIFFSRYLINVLVIKEYFINDRNFYLMQLAISLIVRIRVNEKNYLHINLNFYFVFTGVINTTRKRLDRERQDRHVVQVSPSAETWCCWPG